MSKVLSVRLPDEVAARVGEIASARGVKAPSVLKAAVESYLGDHGRGLPDRSALRPVRVDSVEDARRWVVQRQVRLNKAKERAS